MKRCLAALFLLLSISPFAFSQGIPTRGPDASPEYKKAIEQLNADAAAWNARCVVTRSEAEQSWCEQERSALEARKIALRDGRIPTSSASTTSTYPSVDVTLRYSTRGTILKRVQTDSTGHFTLGTFPASTYIMEFRARKAAGVQGQRFAIQIEGIKEHGRQRGIEAKYLIGGFGVDVETAPATPVKGQVTTGSLAPSKRMVWVPREMGSYLPAHWVEEGSSRHIAGSMVYHYTRETVQKIMDHVDQ